MFKTRFGNTEHTNIDFWSNVLQNQNIFIQIFDSYFVVKTVHTLYLNLKTVPHGTLCPPYFSFDAFMDCDLWMCNAIHQLKRIKMCFSIMSNVTQYTLISNHFRCTFDCSNAYHWISELQPQIIEISTVWIRLPFSFFISRFLHIIGKNNEIIKKTLNEINFKAKI